MNSIARRVFRNNPFDEAPSNDDSGIEPPTSSPIITGELQPQNSSQSTSQQSPTSPLLADPSRERNASAIAAYTDTGMHFFQSQSELQTENTARNSRRFIATFLIPISLFFLISDNGESFWSIIFFGSLMNIVCVLLEPDADNQSYAPHFSNTEDAVEGATARTANDIAAMSVMSFQAQLAAAILESRRLQVFVILDREEGTEVGGANEGVSEEAKKEWVTFMPSKLGTTGNADQVGIAAGKVIERKMMMQKGDDGEEEVCCSICLCEYEERELAVMLPCGHIFHEACVSAWTTNHIRCPLCNLDLVANNCDENGDNNSGNGEENETVSGIEELEERISECTRMHIV